MITLENILPNLLSTVVARLKTHIKVSPILCNPNIYILQ